MPSSPASCATSSRSVPLTSASGTSRSRSASSSARARHEQGVGRPIALAQLVDAPLHPLAQPLVEAALVLGGHGGRPATPLDLGRQPFHLYKRGLPGRAGDELGRGVP